MRNLRVPLFLLVLFGIFVAALTPGAAVARKDGEKVKMEDQCDPSDPAWNPTGGCLNPEGTVTEAEFRVFSFMTTGSPFVNSVIGHPAWRNNPGFVVLPLGDNLKVPNEGGRGHTFTEVPDFGGGRVPPLNAGLTPLTQCGAAVAPVIGPGGRVDFPNLSAGLHKFQCCLHPWMRTVVSVE